VRTRCGGRSLIIGEKARWREPIALAAGSGAAQQVIDVLLALDSPTEPESAEALLAASALAESESGTVAKETIEKVVAQLESRLCSPIPLVAVGAGVAIAEITPIMPDLAAAIALKLWDHPQPWTRLAAICTGISGGSRSIPVGKILEWSNNSSRCIILRGVLIIRSGHVELIRYWNQTFRTPLSE